MWPWELPHLLPMPSGMCHWCGVNAGGQGCARVAVWALTHFHFELTSCQAWHFSKQAIMHCVCNITCMWIHMFACVLPIYAHICPFVDNWERWVENWSQHLTLFISFVFSVPLVANSDSLTGFRITKEASLWVCLWWSLYIRLIEVARPTFSVDSTLQWLVSWTE